MGEGVEYVTKEERLVISLQEIKLERVNGSQFTMLRRINMMDITKHMRSNQHLSILQNLTRIIRSIHPH